MPKYAVGSPVCAGIDPSGAARMSATTRFPRVCGDRPLPMTNIIATAMVPPCVRG